MSTLTGELGQVKIDKTDSAGGVTAIAEIRSWTLTHNQDTIEDTVMGDGARTYKKGLTNFSGSFEGMYDSSHIATNGAVFDLDATSDDGDTTDSGILTGEFITSSASGSKKYTGELLITSIERSASFDDMVTFTANFQGSGVLTEGSV
jgi:predicted secreted protein|tara:strand:- start:1872 stop:2315 length:444 start_codon:yes stop_codon:yes gene_type:complete